MKLKEPLNFAGRLYDAGESVKGKLPLDMIDALRKHNKLDEDQAETEVLGQTDDGLSDPDKLPIMSDAILSPEDFAKLPAPDQKERLKALEIDPASNAENRVEQYEDWYYEQIDNTDPDVQ
ncbi:MULTISPECIES: hypothetical protein [Paenibacillus]|uniref:hypothetical protein n=1 Tax=Paenibacillus TaxID=44249 RepID=UPI0011A3789A|nr:hypothetical protein [Paenibacillus sp. IHBB 10380]